MWSTGQVLDQILPNVITCAFFDDRVEDPNQWNRRLPSERLISVVSVTRERLDSGDWRVVGTGPIMVERRLWPNEQFRDKGWIGAKVYDASILEEFLDAFHGLAPWDDWKEPDYLDRLLLFPGKKPTNLVYNDQTDLLPSTSTWCYLSYSFRNELSLHRSMPKRHRRDGWRFVPAPREFQGLWGATGVP